MSFEGYYQIICKNGHYHTAGLYELYGAEEGSPCPTCSASQAWWNLVDLTNGSYYKDERIDGYVELEVEDPPIKCKCPDCGDIHTIVEPTYKIPEEGHNVAEEEGD